MEKAAKNLLLEAYDQVQNVSCVSEPTYRTVFLRHVAFDSGQLMEESVFLHGFFNLLGTIEAEHIYTNIYMYFFVVRTCICVHTMVNVEITGWSVRVGSFSLPCGFQGLDSGCQV